MGRDQEPDQPLVDGRVLRALRTERGWDQLTLARQAGLDASTISRVERGFQYDLKASALVALAQALAVTVEMLLVLPPVTTPTAASSTLVAGVRESPLAAAPAPFATNPDERLSALCKTLHRLPDPQKRQVVAVLEAYLATME